MPKEPLSPYMPLFVKDWLTGAATVRMTAEQKGAFVDLLAHAWQATPPCTLDDDDELLAKLSGLGRRWSTTGAFVKAQFKPTEDDAKRLRNEKQWDVYQETLARRRKNKQGADETNNKRWGSIAERSDSDRLSDQTAIDKTIASRVGDGIGIAVSNLPTTKKETPSQESVGAVLDAFAPDLRPHPALVARWIAQLGSADAVREIVLQYPNKPATYIGQCVTTAARKGHGNRSDHRSGTKETPRPPINHDLDVVDFDPAVHGVKNRVH